MIDTMKIISLKEAVGLLKTGAVGVMPTDTVYGIVARAEDEAAVERLYAAKSREQKPGTLIAASTDQLLALGVPVAEVEKVAKYWPNPLSAVLTLTNRNYLTQGVGTLAMRVVADENIRQLLEQTGPPSGDPPGRSFSLDPPREFL